MTGLDRRRFLRLAGTAAIGLPVATWAAACSDRGAALPANDDLLLEPGLPVEDGAELHVYEWKEYLSADVLTSFERAHADRGVTVALDSFQHVDEMVAALQSPGADHDVVFPTVDVLDGLAEAGLLRPLQHAYLPHLTNLWPWFTEGDGPPYDPGQRYTTPYTVYSGGIAWRDDMVQAADAPSRRDEPTDIFVDPAYRGLVGLYDSYRDAIALGLQRVGAADLVAPTDDELARAAAFLEEAVAVGDARFTLDGVSEGLTERTFAVHQAWSGDVLTAPRYAAYGGEDPAVVAEVLRYLSPASPERIVGLDLTAIASRGRFPVAAHAFLDHLLRFDVAMDNFAWNGYQVPMREAPAEAFDDPAFPWRDIVPVHLRDALVDEASFAAGRMLVGFGPSEDARWRDQWSRVVPA